MKALKKKFNVPVEGLPVIAGFAAKSFESSLTTFTDYSPDFQQPYLSNYQAKIALVEDIVFPEKIIKEIKVVTERMNAAMEAIRDKLNRLEGYISRAANLTLKPEDFGIKGVRDAISRKDAEKFCLNMGKLITNVDANFDSISAKGFTAAAKEFLVNTKKSVKADNDLQNSKANEKSDLVEDNLEILNDLWDNMTDILKNGKILFKNSDKSKTEEFTLTALKTRVKQERKKKETPPEDGSVPPAQ